MSEVSITQQNPGGDPNIGLSTPSGVSDLPTLDPTGAIAAKGGTGDEVCTYDGPPPPPPPPGPPPPKGGDVSAKLAELAANPWFTPSFAAAFGAIMNEVLQYEMETHYMESQVELVSRSLAFEIAKTNADITRQEAYVRAQEKIVEAIFSFIQAGISAVQVVAVILTPLVGRKGYEKDVSAAEAEVEKARYPGGRVAAGGAAVQPVGDNDPNVARALANLNSLQGAQKFSSIGSHERLYEQLTSASFETMKKAADGTKNSILAGYETKLGDLGFTKEMLRGYEQSLESFKRNTERYRDSAQGSFDKIIDFVNKIIDSTYSAHSLKG